MIDDYKFGSITISGKTYNNDVIVHGDSGSVRGKQRAMREAGITVVDFHSEIVAAVREHLDRMGT